MKAKLVKRKITVQLWAPLLEKLNKETSLAACINRDAYLDIVLAHEAAMLESELGGKSNTDDACAHVKRCLLELKDLKPVSLTLTRKTADAVTNACTRANVWRDVFVNRVIYLLVVKSSALESQWDFKFADHSAAIFDERQETKALLPGPRLTAMRRFITEDPFFAIRAALRDEYPDTKGAIHTLPLGNPAGETQKQRGLAGFSTYLQDDMVPGTSERAKWVAELLEALSEDSEDKKRRKK